MNRVLTELEDCIICPRKCGVNRFSDKLGYCNTNAGFNISSICIHKGEEPVISGNKGICNIFFSHCNIQCIYCQNFQISDNSCKNTEHKLKHVIASVLEILDTGINIVGFVSPSHNIPQIKAIIEILRNLGRNPVFVFNTNAYDEISTIESLDNYINVFLPDFKYSDNKISKQFSDAPNYPVIALKAIQEMYFQKGSTLIINENNYAVSGLIIRHLVLPGYIDNSIEVLRTIAYEISTSLHISLMSQYHPNIFTKRYPGLRNKLKKDDYDLVIKEFEALGFKNGWVQDFDSPQNYLPDFNNPHPFELG